VIQFLNSEGYLADFIIITIVTGSKPATTQGTLTGLSRNHNGIYKKALYE